MLKENILAKLFYANCFDNLSIIFKLKHILIILQYVKYYFNSFIVTLAPTNLSFILELL